MVTFKNVSAPTREEFAAELSTHLICILYEASDETEISRCELINSLIANLVLNVQKNGHSDCAVEMLKDATLMLAALNKQDAEEPRH